MTWYTFLLFAHVSLAVIWVGGGMMMQLFGVRATMSGDPSRMASFGEDVKWIADRVFIAASLLAFVSGILLVIESDFYGFGDDWIVIALALYATTFLAGLLFSGKVADQLLPVATLLVLGTIGFAAVGCVFSAALLRSRSRDVLLSTLLYPIIVPIVIAGARGTAQLIDPISPDFDGARFWTQFMVAVDIIFVTLGLWAFEPVVTAE